MTYKHCNPCNNFDICLICEQEMCCTCGENYDSLHMHLNDEAEDKLTELREEEMLMACDFCNECLFYSISITDRPHDEYDENIVYKIIHEDFDSNGNLVDENQRHLAKGKIETRRRIEVVGPKPERTFTTQKGMFHFPPPSEGGLK